MMAPHRAFVAPVSPLALSPVGPAGGRAAGGSARINCWLSGSPASAPPATVSRSASSVAPQLRGQTLQLASLRRRRGWRQPGWRQLSGRQLGARQLLGRQLLVSPQDKQQTTPTTTTTTTRCTRAKQGPPGSDSSAAAERGGGGGDHDDELYFDGLSYPPYVLEWCCANAEPAVASGKTLNQHEDGNTINTSASNGSARNRPAIAFADPDPYPGVQPVSGAGSADYLDSCDALPVNAGRVDKAFVSTFRMSSPYINAHSGRIFVVHIPGALIDEPLFGSVMEDIALMRIVGVKLVLVLGPRFQIERRLAADGVEGHFVNGIRVTDDHTLQVVKEAAGSMLFEVEGKLARGVVNAPSLSRISVVSGSFYTAQPLGVIEGDDFGYSGKVRRIDAESIERRLNQGDIVIVPNLGYSPTGQLFNCQGEEVAGACAAALGAEKLIFMGNGEAIYDKRIRRSIPNLTLSSASRFLELRADDLPAQFRLSLQVSVRALEKGVTRAHLVNRMVNGVLLMEVFHRDGVGLMISRDLYEGIRLARPQDVAGIEEIIKPLEQEGVLVKRGRAGIEKAIDEYIVVERDGMIISCLSLSVMADDATWGELGCFAVHPDYQKLGKGDAMLGFCERFALKKGVKRLFILSTVTFQWFLERGFKEVSVEELPLSRRARYNKSRKSKIYVKVLEGSRAIDEAEVLKSSRPVLQE